MKQENGMAQLSEREEQLLSKYFDGECGWLGRFRAKQLLGRNSAARSFFEALSLIGTETQQLSGQKVDLWQAINRRIDQEERAALYLGERRASTETKRIVWNPGFTWGASGAMVTAGLAVIVFATSSTSSNTTQQARAAAGVLPQVQGVERSATLEQASMPQSSIQQNSFIPQEMIPQAALVSEGGASPRSLPNSASFRDPLSEMVEVDWMRSNGSLRLLQDPGERSAIIWVKRKRQPLPVFEGPNRSGIKILNEVSPPSFAVQGR